MSTETATPDSLYRATMRPAPQTHPLDGDRNVDVAVIGAGFTGLSAALHLAEGGADVAVIERHHVGWGASGRNGGQVNPGLKWDPDRIESDWGNERGRRMIDFAWSAAEKTFALIRRHGIECDARQGGTLRAAYHDKAAEGVRQTAAQCAARRMPVDFIEGADTQALTGTARYVAIMRDRSGGDLQPLDYANGLARAAIQAGAAIHTSTAAKSLKRRGDRWLIDTDRGRVFAGRVILATNGYSDDLVPSLRRSIVPVFSSIIATEPLPEAVARRIMPSHSSLYESGHITVYYRVDAGNRLLIGGRGPQAPLRGPGAVSYLARYARQLWPALAKARWDYAWNGQLAVTTDHYPHIHIPKPGLMAFVGCNGRGVALSTMLGAELGRLAAGANPEDLPIPVRRIEPIPFHRFWRLGVTAKVMEGRVRDRLDI